MANLKNITDVPVAESAEGLNLIVNDNGVAKQIPASAVGKGNYDVILDTNTGTIIQGSYDNLRSIILNGDIPKGKAIGRGDDNVTHIGSLYHASCYHEYGEQLILLFVFDAFTFKVTMTPDETTMSISSH